MEVWEVFRTSAQPKNVLLLLKVWRQLARAIVRPKMRKVDWRTARQHIPLVLPYSVDFTAFSPPQIYQIPSQKYWYVFEVV